MSLLRAAPLTLEGSIVRLVPLALEHVNDLCEVGLDPAIWRWMPDQVRDPSDMRTFVEQALADARSGAAVPFTTTLRETSQPIGLTRFLNISKEHRRVEIGATWIAPAWQRTRVNTEAKYLMLRHAFETWSCVRVEFKTNALNSASRAALLRLGAVEEGTLRQHWINRDGTLRDSVYFSILNSEWPHVKSHLEAKLAALTAS